MFKVSVIFVYVLMILSAVKSQNFNKKLQVMVLYESLCPDSIRFMQRQLGPSYDALKNFIDIQLVPFGKSQSENNGAQFFCQHGPAECAGNRLHSCVLQQTSDQEKQVKFAVCQMQAPDQNSIKYCATDAGLSANIVDCMTTDKGTHLQLQAEQITHAYAPTFVPTIIYDNVFNQRLQDSSIRNFRGTVCSLLQQRGAVSFQTEACL